MIIVSACLAGIYCRWDGGSNPCKQVIEMVEKGIAIPVCPEQLGGLSTPRIPCEQIGNRVFSQEGIDVTHNFEKGANEALRIAQMIKCNKAILKANSPSCGSGMIYDGTFSGKLIPGDGIFVKLLKKYNIFVLSENDII
ncbi:MAG: DUF523 domain-containing protein [Candidatus Cloacimonetes bacterium]|nr:DUF523 domain-containing protein [Candidatus Cloacimonadota bacterium]